MKQNRFLIFGSGFIAANFADFLLEKKKPVTVVYHTVPTTALPKDIQIKGRVTVEGMARLLQQQKPSFVVLTQGLSFIPHNEKDLRLSVESNFTAPMLVLEALRRLQKKGFGVKKVLTFGSGAEYGMSNRAFKEVDQPAPENLYGLIKSSLYLASEYYRAIGLPCVHIRLFNTVGAGQHPFFVLSSFCRQIALIEADKQKPRVKVGDLSQERDFLDVRDLNVALQFIAEKRHGFNVVNVCSGHIYRISEIIEELKKISYKKFETKIDPKLIFKRPPQYRVLVGDPGRLKSLGFRQRYSFKQTIKWTLDYWRKQVRERKS